MFKAILRPTLANTSRLPLLSFGSKRIFNTSFIRSHQKQQNQNIWRFFNRRNSNNSNKNNTNNQPPQPNKKIGVWLLINGACVLLIVAVGGITRLTESGLSITEWKPITGTIPPLSQADWEVEYYKYTQSPEYKVVHRGITLEEFKQIFFWEYLHRLLGRVIGLSYALPFAYFAATGQLRGALLAKCTAILAGYGFQGVLGWYMVKSGLEQPTEQNGWVRVSQYRLAAHLCSAILLYSGMFWIGLGQIFPRVKFSALPPPVRRISTLATFVTGLVFTTAGSGAFVAGLDAGLVYNSFPKMAGQWIPEEIFRLRPLWRNFFENDATVQFDHRVLAMTTLTSICGLGLAAWNVALTNKSRLALRCLIGMAGIQVGLGIATLLMLVPIPLGVAHQSGSLCLLTISLWLLHQLRRLPK